MLREVSFLLLELIRPNLLVVGPSHKGVIRGFTADVPVGALEREADAKLASATADDTEVDLTQWALPAGTPEESKSRAVLCRFAARWWFHYQERNVRAWLETSGAWGPLTEDREGVEDCVRRMRETTYWVWPRGSRLFFWKFPEE